MDNQLKQKTKVLVTQLGARRHYAVPLALQGMNMLEHFFTDIYFKKSVINQTPAFLAPLNNFFKSRHAPDLLDEHVTSFPLFGLSYTRKSRQIKKITELAHHWQKGGTKFCSLVTQSGFGKADSVYAYSSAALETFEAARKKGISCILDHATAPLRQEKDLVDSYRNDFPGWFPAGEDGAEIDRYTDRQRKEADMADIILCGSTFTRKMLIASGIESSKICVVPLGIKENLYFSYNRSSNSELHVLFAGNDGLRKGVGYLCEAKKKSIIIKAAGTLGLSEKGTKEAAESIELLGAVPRATMLDLYKWADVFVLPSISETFGLVILEAMSHGVPVITTPNTCGPDVISDGKDGFIVPTGDSQELSEKMECLASNAKLLQKMSEKAYDKAKEYSLEKYGERLVSAIRQV